MTIADRVLELIHELESEGFSPAEIMRLIRDPQACGFDFSLSKDDAEEFYDEVIFVCSSKRGDI